MASPSGIVTRKQDSCAITVTSNFPPKATALSSCPLESGERHAHAMHELRALPQQLALSRRLVVRCTGKRIEIRRATVQQPGEKHRRSRVQLKTDYC